jgi:hypothetical protein
VTRFEIAFIFLQFMQPLLLLLPGFRRGLFIPVQKSFAFNAHLILDRLFLLPFTLPVL